MLDFILDEDGDLKIENNDLVIGNADMQNQILMLLLPKGSIKEFPDATVGLSNYIEAEDPAAMLREIRNRLTADGRVIKELSLNNDGKLLINAPYIQ